MPRAKSIALYWGIRDYVKSCREKERSPQTLRWYFQKLELFRLYMAQIHHTASVRSVSVRHVEQFLRALRHTRTGRRVSNATVKGHIQVLQSFFTWCQAQSYTDYNPAKIAADIWKSEHEETGTL